MKTILSFLIQIFLLTNLLSQTIESTITNVQYGAEYFPFNENVELIFDSNVGETSKIVEIKDTLFRVTNTSSKFVYTQSFMRRNDDIYLVRTDQNISTFLYSTEINITYSHPVLQLPLPLKIGDKWNWTGYQVKNNDTTSISITGEALGFEVVETPAGKFETIKIKLFFDEVDGEKTTLYQWLAPNLGAVKTKVIIEGSGILQFAMSLLGYDEIDSELKEINYLK